MIDSRIRTMTREISDLRDMLFSYGSLSPAETLVRVQSSKDPDKLAEAISEIYEKEKELEEKLSGYIKVRTAIMEEILAMEDNRFITVLYERYIRGTSWTQIMDIMGYKDQRWVFRLHGHALEEFKKKYPEKFS